jgi:hypothetical protein
MTSDTSRRGFIAAAAGGTSFLSAPASAASPGNPLQRPRFEQTINVRELGARGDGVSDDSTAFRDAIEMVIRRGGGTIVVPAGHYLLASGFDTRDGQNALLPLPLRQGFRDEMITVRLIGESAVAAFAPPVPSTGTIISTRNRGTKVNGLTSAILGRGMAVGGRTLFSAISLAIHDIAFLVEPASNVVAIDASALQNCILDNVSALINATPGSEAIPDNPDFVAIKLPATGNYGIVKCRNIYVEGFFHGIQHSEHADIEALINQCVAAIHIPESYSHLAKYKITTQRCSYSLWCDALEDPSFPFSNVVTGTLDIERNPQFPFQADIMVSDGALLNGFLLYNVAADPESRVSIAGSGHSHLVLQNGAMFHRIVTGDATVTCNGWFFPIVPLNLAANARIEVTGGTCIGQRLRIFGDARYDVTVAAAAGVTLRFPDGTARPEHMIASGANGARSLELTWTGTAWVATTNSEHGTGESAAEGPEHFIIAAGETGHNRGRVPITIAVPIIFNPDEKHGAHARIMIGPDETQLRFAWSKALPAGWPAGMTDTATFRVPAGWRYRLEVECCIVGEGSLIQY